MSIYNLSRSPKNGRTHIINMMEDSADVYYLTGSRYFGTATDKSDWDFFVQHSEDTVKFLQNLGFSLHYITPGHYKDSELVVLMRNAACMMDVQLVKDAIFKNHIQKMIVHRSDMKEILSKKLHKRYHSAFWDLLYSQANGIKIGDGHDANVVLAQPDITKILLG